VKQLFILPKFMRPCEGRKHYKVTGKEGCDCDYNAVPLQVFLSARVVIFLILSWELSKWKPVSTKPED